MAFMGAEIPISALGALRFLPYDEYLLGRRQPHAKLERPVRLPSAPPIVPLPPSSAARRVWPSSQRRQLSGQLLSARPAEQRAVPVAL